MISLMLEMLASDCCDNLTRELAASNLQAAFDSVDKRNRMLHSMLKMVANGMIDGDPCKPLVEAVLEKCK